MPHSTALKVDVCAMAPKASDRPLLLSAMLCYQQPQSQSANELRYIKEI